MSTSTSRPEAIHPWVAAGNGRMRFGISRLGPANWLATRDFVQMSEGLGFDAFWAADHPQLGSDAWVQLTMLAGATRTIRLGTLVTCVLYRNPVVLTRMVADVDRISGGRVILGIGSGDRPQEFRQMGLPYPPVRERQAALEEGLRVIQPLLRGQTVTFEGKHFQTDGAVLQPAAVQQPHVPILIAGGGEQTTLRLAAEYGDASNMAAASWAGGAFTLDDLRHKYAVLRRHCEAVGRRYDSVLRTSLTGPTILSESPAALQARVDRLPPPVLALAGQVALIGTPEDAIARFRAMASAGVRYVVVAVAGDDMETINLLVERVMPALAGETPLQP